MRKPEPPISTILDNLVSVAQAGAADNFRIYGKALPVVISVKDGNPEIFGVGHLTKRDAALFFSSAVLHSLGAVLIFEAWLPICKDELEIEKYKMDKENWPRGEAIIVRLETPEGRTVVWKNEIIRKLNPKGQIGAWEMIADSEQDSVCGIDLGPS